jgi:signal peptidase I
MKNPRREVVLAVAFILLAVLIYLANPFHTASWDPRIRLYGATFYRMPSGSMEPTIPEGSIFTVLGWPYVRSEPRAGDLIVFKYPLDPTVAYVKRIVATGGSTIEIANGVVLVDGQPVPEGYVPKAAAVSDYSRTLRRIRVTPLSYFVMGDNRDNSEDSRAWGFVPRDHIVGEVGSILIRGH